MTRRIHIPTYDADVILMFDVKRNLVKRYVQNKWDVELDGIDKDFSAITVDMDDLTWLVYIPETNRNDRIWLVKTLSHEANHVTLQLMDKVGVNDEEAICYCQDNLLGEMLKEVEKKRPKKVKG